MAQSIKPRPILQRLGTGVLCLGCSTYLLVMASTGCTAWRKTPDDRFHPPNGVSSYPSYTPAAGVEGRLKCQTMATEEETSPTTRDTLRR